VFQQVVSQISSYYNNSAEPVKLTAGLVIIKMMNLVVTIGKKGDFGNVIDGLNTAVLCMIK
jgi:hypothetical protein